MAIEQLEKELQSLQQRHDSAIKEIGRLESRLQTDQYDYQHENDILKSEVEKIHYLIYLSLLLFN
jgi:hypothetical protein